MSTLNLPPAGEPDPAVETAREQLAAAREERREASRQIALLAMGGVASGPIGRTKRELQLKVAEYSLGLWSDECRRLESVLRSLGVRP